MLIFKSCHQRCSIETCVLKTCTKFTGEHLCQSLFLIKLQAWNFRNIGKVVPGTRNSEPATHTRDPRPETLHLAPGTHRRVLGRRTFTWDLGPATFHLGLMPRDLGPYMEPDPIPLRGTRNLYINANLGALTLIHLSLNVQFSSVA